jgi:hypothetical protein
MTLSKNTVVNMFRNFDVLTMQIGQVCRLLTPSSESNTGEVFVEVTRLTEEYFTVESIA